MIRLKLNFSLVSFFVTKNKMEKSMDDIEFRYISTCTLFYPGQSQENFPLVLPIHKRFSFNINNFLMGFNVKYLYNSIPFYKCQPCFILDFLLFFFFCYSLCHCIKNFNKSKRIMQIKYLYERKYLERFSQIGMNSNDDLTERC